MKYNPPPHHHQHQLYFNGNFLGELGSLVPAQFSFICSRTENSGICGTSHFTDCIPSHHPANIVKALKKKSKCILRHTVNDGIRYTTAFNHKWGRRDKDGMTKNKSSAVAEMGDSYHNRHGPKSGGLLCPFHGGGAGSPSNTKWPGPRSTSVPSGVFIHPAVWPQYTRAKNWGLCPF